MMRSDLTSEVVLRPKLSIVKEFAWKNPEFVWNSNLLITSFKRPWVPKKHSKHVKFDQSEKNHPSDIRRRSIRSGPCAARLRNHVSTYLPIDLHIWVSTKRTGDYLLSHFFSASVRRILQLVGPWLFVCWALRNTMQVYLYEMQRLRLLFSI